MKINFTLILFVCCTALHAQTLTPKLIGNWQFKNVEDATGKPLDGTINPLELNLRKDGSYTMQTKAKQLKGKWYEKDSTLYLTSMPAPDSIEHTQVMRILSMKADSLELYAGAEKGNEIRYVYVRRRKK